MKGANPEAPTLYPDAHKLRMADYKSDKVSKVIQRPHTSVQKSELYVMFMVLLDFPESLNNYRLSTFRELFCIKKQLNLFQMVQN